MKAEIAVSATGRGSVVVDGVDLSNFTRGFVLAAGVDEVTQLELDLTVTEGATVAADAVVTVSPETHALLVHLGWTPPPDETPALHPPHQARARGASSPGVAAHGAGRPGSRPAPASPQKDRAPDRHWPRAPKDQRGGLRCSV